MVAQHGWLQKAPIFAPRRTAHGTLSMRHVVLVQILVIVETGKAALSGRRLSISMRIAITRRAANPHKLIAFNSFRKVEASLCGGGAVNNDTWLIQICRG